MTFLRIVITLILLFEHDLSRKPVSTFRDHARANVDIAADVGHRSAMSSTVTVAARELLRDGSFLFFLASRSLSRFSSQVAAVAIGWQIYDITGNAFDLGMVGLVQFLPTALLVFVAGHASARFERKRVVQLCQV